MDAVKILVDNGADLNEYPKNGFESLITQANFNSQLDILKYFLSYLKAHNFSSGTITVYRDHVYEFLSFYKDYKDLDIELKKYKQ